MYFKQFFDEKLAQYAYLIGCQAHGTAVVIDPMRDIDLYIDAAAKEDLRIVAAADTHIHADYISGLREFAERGVKVYASSEGGEEWQYEWLINSNYNYRLLKDGDEFNIGNVSIKAWHTPGHTPEHLSYFITDGAVADEPMGIATGDFVFAGDVGRPDLLETAAGQQSVMEPSARTLYKSLEKFKNLPGYVQIWPGHGAGSACGKTLGAVPETTVGYELRYNNSIKSATSEDHFVKFILDGQPEPPLYFARMKRENKTGPALIGGVPNVPRLTNWELDMQTDRQEGIVFLDTRDRRAFAEGHIPGSLLSPLNRQFNTVAGSYITEDEEIILVIDEHNLDEAVHDLYRIGLDKIAGFITPEDIQMYADEGGELARMEIATFEAIENRPDDAVVLDVRKASEYEEGHVDKALNIAHARLLAGIDKVPQNKKILVHCQTGRRAAVASALLKRYGFDVVQIDDEFENYRNQHPA